MHFRRQTRCDIGMSADAYSKRRARWTFATQNNMFSLVVVSGYVAHPVPRGADCDCMYSRVSTFCVHRCPSMELHHSLNRVHAMTCGRNESYGHSKIATTTFVCASIMAGLCVCCRVSSDVTIHKSAPFASACTVQLQTQLSSECSADPHVATA